MFGSKKVLSIAIFILTLSGLLAGAVSFAASGVLSATVKSNIGSCKVFKYQNGKFVVAAPDTVRTGQKLAGRLHQVRSDFFVTKIKGDTIAIPTKCLTTVAAPAGTAARAAPRAPVEVLTGPGDRFQARFRFLFYQDNVDITDDVNGNYTIVSHVTAICPGVAYRKPLTAKLNWIADACVMIGFGDTRGSPPSGAVTYSFDNAFTLGARIVPGVELAFKGKDMRVGLGIPILFSTTSWAPTESGATASGSGLRFPGLLLTFDGTRDRFGFVADFGFLKKITQTMFSLGISYRL